MNTLQKRIIKYSVITYEMVNPIKQDILLGDASKAKEKLGWEPKVNFKQLIRLMVEDEFNSIGLNSSEYIID